MRFHMKLKFEEYELGSRKSDGVPEVSVISRGGFFFTASFVHKFIPHRPTYVILKYTQDQEYIYVGFLFSKEKRKNGLKVSYPKKSYGGILATGFFNKYHIDSKKYKGRYVAEEYIVDLAEKLFFIKLKK